LRERASACTGADDDQVEMIVRSHRQFGNLEHRRTNVARRRGRESERHNQKSAVAGADDMSSSIPSAGVRWGELNNGCDNQTQNYC
jgi:hypothetical protein